MGVEWSSHGSACVLVDGCLPTPRREQNDLPARTVRFRGCWTRVRMFWCVRPTTKCLFCPDCGCCSFFPWTWSKLEFFFVLPFGLPCVGLVSFGFCWMK